MAHRHHIPLPLEASQKDLPEPFVLLVQKQLTIETKERTHDRGQDILSMYDQDVLFLSVPAVKEMLVVLGFVNHSSLVVLE